MSGFAFPPELPESMKFEIECSHPKLKRPKFDAEKSRGKDADWVRRHYPRGYQHCPDCDADVILYASFEHYLAGDW